MVRVVMVSGTRTSKHTHTSGATVRLTSGTMPEREDWAVTNPRPIVLLADT